MINSPFLQNIESRRDKLVKTRKKIYKYLQKQNKNQHIDKQNCDIIRVLKKLELPEVIINKLSMIQFLPLQRIDQLIIPIAFKIQELQILAEKQEHQTQQLNTSNCLSKNYKHKSKKRFELTNTKTSLSDQKSLFQQENNMWLQQICLNDSKYVNFSDVKDVMSRSDWLANDLQQRGWFKEMWQRESNKQRIGSSMFK